MFTFFKSKQFKALRWLWIWALILLLWQIYSNIAAAKMMELKSNESWTADGPGNHK